MEEDPVLEWLRTRGLALGEEQVARAQARGPVNATDGIAHAEFAKQTEFCERVARRVGVIEGIHRKSFEPFLQFLRKPWPGKDKGGMIVVEETGLFTNK